MEACFNAKEPVPAPVTDRVLAKGCQDTESFTQETQDKQESQEAQAPQESQESQAIHVLHDRRKLEEKECVDGEAKTDIETAIASHRLPGIETFTVYAFPFASCLRGIELRHHFRFGPVLLRSIYDKWADNNHQFLTGDRDYYSEFLAMMSKVRFPKGYLRHVLQVAREKATPTRALSCPPPVQLLAKLCRELQEVNAGKTFYLACRAVGDLFDCSHATAANWLLALGFLDIIEVVSVGNKDENLASEYRYIARD